MAAIKPATPLPWNRRVDAGQSMYAEAVEGKSPKVKTITVARIASGLKRREQDAAYIVAAANNYPRLVEALRSIANRVPPNVAGDGATETARAVLRELGEA